MEHVLTCNNLKCRKEVGDRAVVTTCSHIFCLDCARRSGLPSQDAVRGATCPACSSQLAKPEDALVSNLNPSEDFKTNILSGLCPNIIMECAGRALSFWAYQTTQEIYYQQYLYKTLADKYSALAVRLEQTTGNANAEIERLQHKLECAASERDGLRRKNEELAQAYRDKSRKLLQTQEIYDKVKRKAEMGHIQQAASDAVDSTFYGAPQPPPALHRTDQEYGYRNGVPGFGRSGGPDIDGALNQGISHSSSAHVGVQQNHWPRHRSEIQAGELHFPTGGGVDERPRPVLPSLFGKAGFPNRLVSTPLPFQMGNRRCPGLQTPGFTQPRGGLSGMGLSSGLKVSQSVSSAGFGPGPSAENHCRLP